MCWFSLRRGRTLPVLESFLLHPHDYKEVAVHVIWQDSARSAKIFWPALSPPINSLRQTSSLFFLSSFFHVEQASLLFPASSRTFSMHRCAVDGFHLPAPPRKPRNVLTACSARSISVCSHRALMFFVFFFNIFQPSSSTSQGMPTLLFLFLAFFFCLVP